MSRSTTEWLPEGKRLFVWRLSNYPDISGRGGLIASGRWHSRGQPVVYTADDPATAAAEVLAKVGPAFLVPEGLLCVKIAIVRAIRIEAIEERTLPAAWRGDHALCRPLGDAWLAGRSCAVLRVPSAPAAGRFNFVLNPLHDDFRHIDVVEVIRSPFPDWLSKALS